MAGLRFIARGANLKKLSALICFAVSVLMSCTASAAFVLSIESDTFQQNSGVQALNVLIRANDAYATNFLTADFEVSGGANFTDPAGTFGQPGQVGAGNVDPASAFVGQSNQAYLSLDFTTSQTIPTTFQEIVTVSFDTTGLAPGTYDVSFLDIQAQGSGYSGTGGSFTIAATAVPEPTSFALVGLAGAGAYIWRRRRQVAGKDVPAQPA